ncbi:MAG TPA: globin [Chromatiales bacterium]|nr:globin [Thiotrichales bacterium]HIP68401.1 globin [Chromatiales bacterium]
MLNPQQTPYAQLGGEEKVRQLVNRFYDLMDELPEAYEVRKLHAESLDSAREKLFKFLSGWLGGPPLYEQEYGHPMLRRRHLPFAIGERERDQWLMCMQLAMDEVGIQGQLRQHLDQAFFRTADHMRNQVG